MPERCPGDHPHLYSFFKHENKFYRVGEGDFFGGPFFLIQSNSWLADSAVAPFEGNESEARRKGRRVLFLIPISHLVPFLECWNLTLLNDRLRQWLRTCLRMHEVWWWDE